LEVLSILMEEVLAVTVEVLTNLTEEVLFVTVEVLSATVEVLLALTEEVLSASMCWSSGAKSCVGLLICQVLVLVFLPVLCRGGPSRHLPRQQVHVYLL
jgi:hypothetical protein